MATITEKIETIVESYEEDYAKALASGIKDIRTVEFELAHRGEYVVYFDKTEAYCQTEWCHKRISQKPMSLFDYVENEKNLDDYCEECLERILLNCSSACKYSRRWHYLRMGQEMLLTPTELRNKRNFDRLKPQNYDGDKSLESRCVMLHRRRYFFKRLREIVEREYGCYLPRE